MCGIVGYIGDKSATAVLIVGLTKLEYRGYDSAGVAIVNGKGVQLRRAVGKLKALEDSLNENPIDGHIGIAHTRWATHGEPNETNSHPHRDASETVFVCHNGIIENYAELRRELQEEGVEFRSQTDTEVLPNLIKRAYDQCGDLPQAVRQALSKVRGAYAISVLHKDVPEMLVAARQASPLIIGLGEGENFCASDVPAILNKTRRVIFLDDGEMAILRADEVEVCDIDDGKVRHKSIAHIEWSAEQAEKGSWPHFMLKEIHEQPQVIRNLLARYTNERGEVVLNDIGLSDEQLRGVKRIFIQACGTSWHSGLIGKLLLERLGMIAVDVDTSSEFRYRNVADHARGAILHDDTLVIGISQSGETADTKAGLEEAKTRGLKVLSIVNVVGSAIARLSDGVIYTNAGPEISVASTKAFTAQIGALYLLSLKLGQVHGLVDEDRMRRRLERLAQLPKMLEEILADDSAIRAVAEKYHKSEHALFIGRGYGYPSALEGALKLKEISYIHAEGYSAGELKHGPLALIDEKMPVVAIANARRGSVVYEKILSNMQEVKARKGQIIAIADADDHEIADKADFVIPVPEVTESLSPFVTAIPLQMLAYHIAVLRGFDVDQPRNLAKSVTVE
jgi:glucosamine--fructose-6-phosphate aminotransferase (isomerizing)